MGAELYAHFAIERQGIESEELAELAAAAGTTDVPSAGEEDRVVARLDSASKAREGQDVELWVDVSKLMLFDLETGRNLAVGDREPAATGS